MVYFYPSIKRRLLGFVHHSPATSSGPRAAVLVIPAFSEEALVGQSEEQSGGEQPRPPPPFTLTTVTWLGVEGSVLVHARLPVVTQGGGEGPVEAAEA